MGAILRCKLRVSEVLLEKSSEGKISQERIKLHAVNSYGGPENSENAQFSKYTPIANFEIYINNPEAFDKLSKGHEFYVDFIPAEKKEE